MEETQTPMPAQDSAQTPCEGPDCPKCAEADKATAEAEEIGMAILVALMPLLSITLFGNMGLI